VSSFDEWQQRTGLEYRDGFAQWRQVETNLIARGADLREPVVSVIVPTYKRGVLLVDALQSVLAQDWDQSFEIVIVDNDPASQRHATLLEELPALAQANYSYYVHRENMGWIGNFNRGMELARAPWLTILNDDDLLDSDFLRRMFDKLDADLTIDGLACRKRSFVDGTPPIQLQRHSIVHRAAYGLLTLHRYRTRTSRRIRPHHFFWAPLLGNMVGFVFRKERALEIGGFYKEDWPSDCWFYIRFAAVCRLDQSRHVLASMRLGQNQSLNPKIAREALLDGHLVRQALVRRQVPKWYMCLAPLISARNLAETRDFWGVEVSHEEAETILGIALPEDRPTRYRAARFLLNGF
jgi:glycosyltransferase involved in cell wall biosynthesis